MNSDNNKKTWKDVWQRLSVLETQLGMIIENTKEIPALIERVKNLEEDCDNNKKEHKAFWDTFVSKNAFKVTSIISGILLFVITVIEIIRVL